LSPPVTTSAGRKKEQEIVVVDKDIDQVVLEEEPDAKAPNVTTVGFKFPDNSRIQRRFLKTTKVEMLYAFVKASNKLDSFDLFSTGPPMKNLGESKDNTLQEADVCASMVTVRSSS
jgi:hypothetical protein